MSNYLTPRALAEEVAQALQSESNVTTWGVFEVKEQLIPAFERRRIAVVSQDELNDLRALAKAVEGFFDHYLDCHKCSLMLPLCSEGGELFGQFQKQSSDIG